MRPNLASLTLSKTLHSRYVFDCNIYIFNIVLVQVKLMCCLVGKNTAQKSALRIARESELYGGVLSTTLGREHLAITAEFLKGDE